jgi:hypothetical protein
MSAGRLLLTICLLNAVSFSAYAKGDSKKKPGMVYLAAGPGIATIDPPKGIVDVNTAAMGEIGGTFDLLGPVVAGDVAAYGSVASGSLKYDFTDENDVDYSGNDVDFNFSRGGLRVGLLFRVVNAKFFRFYIGGGGLYAKGKYEYSAEDNSQITGAGSNYEKSQKDITEYGYYGDAGFDIVFYKGAGIRFGARATNTKSDAVNALAKSKPTYKEGYAYFGIFWAP